MPFNAFWIWTCVLYWLREYTAQIVAGNQPSKVICSSKQMIPAIGRPMVKKTMKGRKMARSRRMVYLSFGMGVGSGFGVSAAVLPHLR